MTTETTSIEHRVNRQPWNKCRLIGPKPPLKLKDIWAIRIRLQMAERTRDLALFNLAIDSKLRGCDIVKLQVRDVAQNGHAGNRATVMQQKTSQPVKFELTAQTREAIDAWTAQAHLDATQYLFPSRLTQSPHISTRQYARIVKSWIAQVGLNPRDYGTHSMAPNQSHAHLQTDQESACGAVAAGPHQAGEYRALSGHRG